MKIFVCHIIIPKPKFNITREKFAGPNRKGFVFQPFHFSGVNSLLNLGGVFHHDCNLLKL